VRDGHAPVLGQTSVSVIALYARVAVAAGFLSAVADRFGLWGAPGDPGVAWGAFGPFTEYTGTLLWFMPEALVPLFAWAATLAEISLGLLLLLGLWTRVAGAASGLLLLSFALTMAVEGGVKGPLDFSVFAASAAGFLLAAIGGGRWSMDGWRAPPG
jgi:putative oxidoreductase